MTSATSRSFRMYRRLAFAIVSLGLVVQQPAMAAADAFDEALDKLVADAVKAVEESGKKKIAVLDFPDIAGANSAFGKYLAEQVSVGMVTAKKEFTIVDRANLRSILAEHQLTEEGLVKPENAKQLGEFSGVDALVLGTITSVSSGHIITVKVLATDKAELVGAAKAKLPLNPDFDTVISTDMASGDSKTFSPNEKKNAREFKTEYFSATVKKFQILKSGEIVLLMDFLKIKNELGVSIYLDGYKDDLYAYYNNKEAAQKAALKALMETPTFLRSSTGEEYRLVEVNGLSVRNFYTRMLLNRGPASALSDIQPATATFQFKPKEGGRAAIPATTTFTLDCSIGVGTQQKGNYSNDMNIYQEAGNVNIHIEGIR